jgi:hypothetical protein
MKYIFSLYLCLFFVSITGAQQLSNRFLEAGAMFGGTSYSGDVSEKRIELNETNPGFGFFVRYHLNSSFSLKAHIYSGSIAGDDKNTGLARRKYRFGTSIFETALVGEWFFFPHDRYSSTGIFKKHLQPYIFGGIGLTFADPKAEYYGNTPNQDLKVPLPEEGLKNKFVLAPIGVGLRAELLDWFSLGLEGGFRPVFSDDLDGMKVNGNPNSGDWYYFAGLTISVMLGGGQ